MTIDSIPSNNASFLCYPNHLKITIFPLKLSIIVSTSKYNYFPEGLPSDLQPQTYHIKTQRLDKYY